MVVVATVTRPIAVGAVTVTGMVTKATSAGMAMDIKRIAADMDMDTVTEAIVAVRMAGMAGTHIGTVTAI